ncbi:hypothetical protein [Lignipirellula cremea]|uniref:Uncharacterized protein n=1 Tax=Lignipirellula cremea TaxID=2528010 RepID=A0A518DSP6_9BACT|nr:hypothetical protein [Lignipirellula cremea]QDU94863.1 hypothetical protein Pla8534_26710 [Lignipirellula cremea]
MQAVGDAYRRAGVAAIYLIHGTFVGHDAWGVIRRVSLVSPAWSESLRRFAKGAIDRVIRDSGNYTEAYAQALEDSINRPGERHLPVRLFHWSSENHHLGRADGAVRLLHELASAHPQGGRLLFWSHSHGGNLLALVTNLLAAEANSLRRFFWASRSHYRWPLLGRIDLPIWPQVRELLIDPDSPLHKLQLDIATFGTPIRYGWDSDGYASLAHLIFHRELPETPAYLTRFPRSLEEVLQAANGDYVQQLGIGGTNWGPNPLAFRAKVANRRLAQLLQGRLSRRQVLDNIRLGVRCPDEGDTLLIDYGPLQETFAEHLAGHAVYTRLKWLLFHAETIAELFYGGTRYREATRSNSLAPPPE